MNNVITRNDSLNKIGLDVEAPGASFMASFTAHERHASRVEATKRATYRTSLGGLYLLMDLLGAGGHCGTGINGRSARCDYFSGLGSGHWNSADGEAYRVAAKEVLKSYFQPVEEFRDILLEAKVDEQGELIVSLSGTQENDLAESILLPLDPDEMKLVSEAGLRDNLRALARRAMLVLWDGEHPSEEFTELQRVAKFDFADHRITVIGDYAPWGMVDDSL